jgi:uncharacterized Ntn-hydrolase superfamily protein
VGCESTDSNITTFSIVAFEPSTGDFGVAVASHYFAVGSVVPWAEAGVGAIATQANVNVSLGALGLELLRSGLEAQEVLDRIIERDHLSGKEGRQLAVIDRNGHVAAFTGEAAPSWAGSAQGNCWSVQGNLLSGPQVIESMGRAFESTKGDLPEKLFASLKAGDDAGGDSRGRQSAAILVVGKERGRNLGNDWPVDIRVDDHPDPFPELRRLLVLNLAYLYLDRSYKALVVKDFAEAAKEKKYASLYSNNPDTRLRVAFLEYFVGERGVSLAEFDKIRQEVPDFEALWRGTVLGRPAFKAVLDDREFMAKLFPMDTKLS